MAKALHHRSDAFGVFEARGSVDSLFGKIKNLFSFRERRAGRKIAAMAVAPGLRVSDENGWITISSDDRVAFEAFLSDESRGLSTLLGDEDFSLGSHLLVEFYGCRSTTLEKEDEVGYAMRDAALQSKATVVAQSFHEFKPYGVSGAVIIQESHYTIHTWPEHGYAAVDLFYCGGTVDVRVAIDVLSQNFKPERVKFMIVRRGLYSEVSQQRR